jgi:molybdenum cofactor cytidylyltransferase
VAAARAAGLPVILVTGFRGEELAAVFAGTPGVTVVHNPAWELGMFSSVRRGVAAAGSGGFFVTPADMPWITADHYARLLGVAGAEVVFPAHGGRRGHPVLFNGAVRNAVLAADPSTGRMREIAALFRVAEMAWEDDSILRDIDTKEDLA